MKFADRICPLTVNNRYSKPKEVETIKVVSYSYDEISMSFEYDRGDEGRKITLDLTKQEAIYLIAEISAALKGEL